MVAKRMGSQGGGGGGCNSIVGTQTQAQVQTQIQTLDPKSNPPLVRVGSLYNLTLDEVESQLGDLGKPLSSMNLDELLKTVFTVEAGNQGTENVEYGEPGLGRPLNRQSSLKLTGDLSKKTVDEVWQDIQEGQNSCTGLDRKGTLGEMTLEDFLVKAGVVAETSPGKENLEAVVGGVDPSVVQQAQQGHWMNYSIPAVHPQQQQQGMVAAFVPGHPVQPPIPIGGNHMMDGGYPEAQMTMSSSPLMGTLSDTQTTRRKRVPPDEIVEKSVERRQKRMIKNRESAARSRARKQAYTHELENKVARLEEENERLKRQKEWEKVLPAIPPPEPKYQLRRTSSGPL